MSAQPTCLSRVQGPFQAAARPAEWCFGVRSIRRGTAQWRCEGSVHDFLAALRTAVVQFQTNGLAGTHKVRIGKDVPANGFMRLENYTQTAEWLDVTEFHATSQDDGVLVQVLSFSSGFIPTCCPLGPLFSIVLCWLPFSDLGPEVRK